jgi:hypothetical protein
LAGDSDGRPEHESEALAPAEVSTDQAGTVQGTEFGIQIPEEILAGVPSEHRQAIVRAFSSVTQFAAPVLNPIFQRVTSEHVTGIIDNTENESVREHDANKSQRRYQFAYYASGASLIAGLIVFFTLSDNRDLILPIVTAVAGFLGGLATGQRFRS